MADFVELKGRILTKVENNDSSLWFHTDSPDIFVCYHPQDCCESVYVEDIVGDLEDLIGTPILVAEESTSDDSGEYDLSVWTFYKLSTIKGSVTIRWYGTSNGYYSVNVSTELVHKMDDGRFINPKTGYQPYDL